MPPSEEKVTQRANVLLRILLCFALTVAVLLGVVEPKAEAFVNIRGTVETAMENLFQGPVDIGGVELSSLNRILIKDLVAKDPLDNSSVILKVDELVLRYSILGLVVHLNNVEKAINEIVLRKPQLWVRTEDDGQWNVSRLFKRQTDMDGATLDLLLSMDKGLVVFAGTNFGIGDIHVGLDGALKVSGPCLALEQASIAVFDSRFTASGTLTAESLDLTLKGSQLDLGSITRCFPQTKDTIIRGQANMEVRASGSVAEPVIDGMVSMGRGSLEFPAHDTGGYSIDSFETFFRYAAQELEIIKLEIAQRDARFQARGFIDNQGSMKLDVVTQGLDLGKNLRFLEAYGIDGKANVAGVLSGTVLRPEFRGELYVAKGRFWGQSYDELRGHVALDISDLQLTGWNIRKGRSIYALAGSIGFGASPRIDINLQSSAGRAEDILAALGIPGELAGRLDGTLEFVGNRGAMTTRGKIYMSEASFQDQAFESAAAEFVLEPDRMSISKGSVSLSGGGTLSFSGVTQGDGTLVLDVKGYNILAERLFLPKDLADTLKGRVNLIGTASLKGSLAKPWLRMQLAVDEPLNKTAAGMEVDVLLQGRQIVVNRRDAQVPARTN
ncbi:MAG: hypothetical protein GX998_03560 [Firmicutes bacterium]|nr:hypothetical protein [Bacillota bacterium]